LHEHPRPNLEVALAFGRVKCVSWTGEASVPYVADALTYE